MADCKRKTANLFDLASWIIANGSTYTKDGESYTFETKLSMHNSPYYFSETDIPVSISGILENISSVSARIDFLHADGTVSSGNVITDTKVKSENLYAAGLRFDWSTGGTITLSKIMLNTGSTALPYEPYWLHSLRKLTTSTDAITTLPADLYADGTNATVGLKGNMSQTGTPTPSAPISVNGVGNKTANLWSENYSGISENLTYVPIYVGNGEFTLSTTTPFSGLAANLFFLAGNVASGASTGVNGVYLNRNITVTAIDGYVTICYRNATANPEQFETMLNSGSTALDYEPYGYKIPISSANTTTPVYLGEVGATRKIKKYELTGLEDWRLSSSLSGVFWCNNFNNDYDNSLYNIVSILCTHYQSTANQTGFTNLSDRSLCLYCYNQAQTNYHELYIRDTSQNTLEDFKAYLAAQYAAGTPVTVWYVLATETTGIVNEPIRKIGSYADTVSGISIPTITGKDTFDVLTSLKPSEVSLAYTGWHDSSAKEWDGSQWL